MTKDEFLTLSAGKCAAMDASGDGFIGSTRYYYNGESFDTFSAVGQRNVIGCLTNAELEWIPGVWFTPEAESLRLAMLDEERELKAHQEAEAERIRAERERMQAEENRRISAEMDNRTRIDTMAKLTKFKRERITVRNGDGESLEIDAETYAGLAFNKALGGDNTYNITHVAIGCALHTGMNKTEARRFAIRLAHDFPGIGEWDKAKASNCAALRDCVIGMRRSGKYYHVGEQATG